MKKTSIMLLLLGMTLAALPAQAEIYKWTDSNGKVQYSDAPPDPAKAKIVKTAPAPATATGGASWEEKDREYRARKAKQGAAAPSEEDPQRASERLCSEAHARLANLDGKKVYHPGPNGERVFIEDSERATMEKTARENIARHCPR